MVYNYMVETEVKMSYQVLYRRFRPKTFSDIVGQEHITEILKNQIKNNRVAHAYLFTGSRGTGKTSTAKVFANAVNCLEPVGGEPCGKCAYCVDPTVDVIEIDAASNRGIDEIRSLRDKVNYMPAVGKYRVYIIDEVHMLTTEAFNALLKTLEEPPEHIVFIFATTEVNKLLPTILSRCQRFDFVRIPINTLVGRMKDILGTIGVGYEEEALYTIAENSDGALRDALSFLDKAINFGSGDYVAEKDVISSLGLMGSRDVMQIAGCIINEDINGAFVSLDTAIKNGADVINIISSLIEYFRDCMMCINTQNPSELIQKSRSYIKNIGEIAGRIDNELLVIYINNLSKLRNDAKSVRDARSLLECEIIRLSDREKLVSDYSLTVKVEQLEKRLSALADKLKNASFGEVRIIERVVEDHPHEEPATEPEMPKRQSQGMRNVPVQYSCDREQLRVFQDAVNFAANYVMNRDRMITLSNIFHNLKVYGYTDDTIYVYPAGIAVSIMTSYDQRGGKDILERAVAEKVGKRYEVVVTSKPTKKPEAPPAAGKPEPVVPPQTPNRPKLRVGRSENAVKVENIIREEETQEMYDDMADAYSEENLMEDISVKDDVIYDDIPDISASAGGPDIDITDDNTEETDDFQDFINDTFGELTEL